MTETAIQQTTNKCSHCNSTFDSTEGLREHEVKCKPRVPTTEEVKEDMRIEDRFEATDH